MQPQSEVVRNPHTRSPLLAGTSRSPPRVACRIKTRIITLCGQEMAASERGRGSRDDGVSLRLSTSVDAEPHVERSEPTELVASTGESFGEGDERKSRANSIIARRKLKGIAKKIERVGSLQLDKRLGRDKGDHRASVDEVQSPPSSDGVESLAGADATHDRLLGTSPPRQAESSPVPGSSEGDSSGPDAVKSDAIKGALDRRRSVDRPREDARAHKRRKKKPVSDATNQTSDPEPPATAVSAERKEEESSPELSRPSRHKRSLSDLSLPDFAAENAEVFAVRSEFALSDPSAASSMDSLRRQHGDNMRREPRRGVNWTDDLTPDEAEILDQLRTELSNDPKVLPELMDDNTLIRFLKARKFSAGKSRDMFLAYCKWRRKYAQGEGVPAMIQNLDIPRIRNYLSSGIVFFPGKDCEGHPVLWIRSAVYKPKEYDFATLVDVFVATMECFALFTAPPVDSVTLLIDLKNLGWGNVDMKLTKVFFPSTTVLSITIDC
jgi:CRAL/TRIO domain